KAGPAPLSGGACPRWPGSTGTANKTRSWPAPRRPTFAGPSKTTSPAPSAWIATSSAPSSAWSTGRHPSLSGSGIVSLAFGCLAFGGSPVAEHRVVLGSEEALGHGLGEEWGSTLAGLLL